MTDWTDYDNKGRYIWDLARLSPDEYCKYYMKGICPISGMKPNNVRAVHAGSDAQQTGCGCSATLRLRDGSLMFPQGAETMEIICRNRMPESPS